ncbi:MAG: zinc transporter ZupT [Planctomycetes bacterium]|jgi:ZIP family zinc transporter|nr:zinc transporter ZupT [Planctomycetota bacterium]
MPNVSFAFLLTFIAGLSTVLGGSFVFLFKRINSKLMSFGLGFSAGVMIYLSFFELLKEAGRELHAALGREADWRVVIFFILGLALAAVIDLITVHQAKICRHLNLNKHEQKKGRDCLIYRCDKQQKLLKTGFFVAFAIALHNFPEGMITFTAANVNYVFGLSVALAVAIHNIPEGFCVSLPIFYATGKRVKSIFYALLAGLAEPLGALAVYFFLGSHLSPLSIGVMLAVVAGIMVYISIDELLPLAFHSARWPVGLSGLAAGLIIMASGLYLLNQ